tara:strand:- start:2770 stop:3915 length:1146 start_codon:yes stop_codon:yes gene_type:complete
MKIVVITGEESGDQLGASLLIALEKIYDQKLDVFGIGGKALEERGLKKFYDISEINVMGIVEVVPKIFHIKKIINNTVDKILEINPDIVLTIDSPDFTLRIAKKLKKKNNNLKIVHFVAPSVWIWRSGRIKTVKESVDHLLTILPFEKEIFEKENIDTSFVGHPITEIDIQNYSGTDLSEISNDIKKEIMLVLPGSRKKEVEKLLPIYLETIRQSKWKDRFDVVIPATENMHDLIRDISNKRFSDIKAVILSDEEQKFKSFYLADYAITTSGTAALELSYFGVAYVSGYKFNILTYFLMIMLIKMKMGNLINIIINKMLIPELLQSECTPQNINYYMNKILDDSQYRDNILKGTKDAIDSLNVGSGTSELAAKAVLRVYQS